MRFERLTAIRRPMLLAAPVRYPKGLAEGIVTPGLRQGFGGPLMTFTGACLSAGFVQNLMQLFQKLFYPLLHPGGQAGQQTRPKLLA